MKMRLAEKTASVRVSVSATLYRLNTSKAVAVLHNHQSTVVFEAEKIVSLTARWRRWRPVGAVRSRQCCPSWRRSRILFGTPVGDADAGDGL
jgi:hypothetical protein